MQVAILGYGKMGQAIAAILKERGHQVILTATTADYSIENLQKADVAIEFSQPEAAVTNLQNCFTAKTPVVCGTTGWLNQYQQVANQCSEKGGGLLYASNFSLGVNLFFAFNQKLAQLMGAFEQYAPAITEIHHTQKKDAPSGTAITLAEQIIEQNTPYHTWSLVEKGKQISPHALPITALRKPDVTGTHRIKYQSQIDEISIKHKAYSRKGFALGAALAAEFMQDKQGVFSMQDVLKIKDL